MSTETIEQKVYRVFGTTFADTDDVEIPTFDESMNDLFFARVCKAVSILIAEEREACANECDRFENAYEAALIIRARGL